MQRVYRATVFALYQVALVMGIVLMPLALVTQRVGLRPPMDRVILGLKAAYERAEPEPTDP